MKIKSIGDIFKIIDKNKTLIHWKKNSNSKLSDYQIKWHHGIWFRGQADFEWSLRPSVFREDSNSVIEETSTFYGFKNRSTLNFEGKKNTFEWLTLMQHYGIPTRLLDWSESVLVGIYFAVSNPVHYDKDGALFILNAKNLSNDVGINYVFIPENMNVIVRAESTKFRKINSLKRSNEISNCDEDDYFDINTELNLDNLRKSIPVFPHRNNLRIQAQNGMFTIAGGKLDVFKQSGGFPDPIHLEEQNKQLKMNNRFLLKIKIDKNYKEKLLQELYLLGINESVLFPEPEYLGKFISDYWKVSKTK